MSGMTGSGKSWLYKLFKSKETMLEKHPKIIYCHSIWTKLFNDFEKILDIDFMQGFYVASNTVQVIS